MTKKSKYTDTKNYQNTKIQQNKKQGTTDLQNNQKKIHQIATVSTYLLIITLSINELNYPIKAQND